MITSSKGGDGRINTKMNIRETGFGICMEFNCTVGDFGIRSA